MVSPVKDEAALLNTFDYNICRLYYPNQKHSGEYGVIHSIKHHGSLSLTGDPATLPAPAVTLSRGYEFARRYGMVLPDSVVKKLCALVNKTDTALPPPDTTIYPAVSSMLASSELIIAKTPAALANLLYGGKF